MSGSKEESGWRPRRMVIPAWSQGGGLGCGVRGLC